MAIKFILNYDCYSDMHEESFEAHEAFEAESLEDAKLYASSRSDYNTLYTFDEWWAKNKIDVSKTLNKLKEHNKRGIWWYAVPDTTELISYIMGSMWQGKSPVKHHHVTMMFDAIYSERPGWMEDSHRIQVQGLAWNDKCTALKVARVPGCCNKVAHVTLATADGVPPVYSNDMLAGKDGAYSFLPLEAELEGQLEFFEFS